MQDRKLAVAALAGEKSFDGNGIAHFHAVHLFRQIAKCHGRSTSQIVFRFALDVGMIPLTGTTNADHMRADLEVFDFQLDRDEVARIEQVAAK